MSLLPTYKICQKCKRKYSWNPDVGKLQCPHCGAIGGSYPLEKVKKKVSEEEKCHDIHITKEALNYSSDSI